MTLKEELEIFRGEPIGVMHGDPLEIPCVETSDPERLCRHPVVTVSMLAYNHERYIRQAIEGVMMQRTDFEFELVIGEDCSVDRTREICFEYQKLHPDKIRVLWSDHNLNQFPHPAGGNEMRTIARWRGEFIALCEGDDYWTDPLKLQKQVDVLRCRPNVGFCFCGAKILQQDTGKETIWNDGHVGFEPGLIPSLKYMLFTMFGRDPSRWGGPEYWQMTATFIFRKSLFDSALKNYDVNYWDLVVGDSMLCLGIGSMCDAYYIDDNVAVYRRTSSGVTAASMGRCSFDTLIVRMYFARKVLRLDYSDLPDTFVNAFFDSWRVRWSCGTDDVGDRLRRWTRNGEVGGFLRRPMFAIHRMLDFDPVKVQRLSRWIFYYSQFMAGRCVPSKVRTLYAQVGCRVPSCRRANPFKHFLKRLVQRLS